MKQKGKGIGAPCFTAERSNFLWKRATALLLAIVILFSMLPAGALAAEITAGLEDEAALREELRAAVDAAEYPNGVIELLTPNMTTSEDLSCVEFAIVRKGPAKGRASVMLKAVDVTAKYAEDYTISIPGIIGQQVLPENPDTAPLIGSFDDSPTVFSSVYSAVPGGEILLAPDAALPEKDAEIGGNGLRAARDAFTGTRSQRANWREAEAEEASAALDSQKKLYEKLPGVTYTLTFEEGEYLKKLRFNTIDDDISEDEEQVLLALLNVTGAGLGENSAGYMNIVDNEDKEPLVFELEQKELSVTQAAYSVDVTVIRTSGFYRYGSISVGTSAVTAQPDTDYVPVLKELVFVPGQTSQTVTIPLLGRSLGADSQLLVMLDPESKHIENSRNTQTRVTLESVKSRVQALALAASTPLLSGAASSSSGSSRTIEIIEGKKYLVETLTPEDAITSGSMTNVKDGFATVTIDHDFSLFKEVDPSNVIYFPANLQEVDYVSFSLKVTSTVKTPLKNGRIPSWLDLYKQKNHGYLEIGSGDYDWANPPHDWNVINSNPFSKQYKGYRLFIFRGDLVLTETTPYALNKKTDQTKNKLYMTYIRDYLEQGNVVPTFHVKSVKLYKKTNTIVLKDLPEAPEANVTPKVWTSKLASTPGKAVYAGALTFGEESDVSQREYGIHETVSLLPQFADTLSDSGRAGIYLWGFKIERKGAGGYYQVQGDSLDLSALHAGSLKDVNGSKVLLSEVLMSNDIISLLPIYRARTAFVQFNYDAALGEMAGNSFTSGDLLRIGMLDTVRYRLSGKNGKTVTGITGLASNNPQNNSNQNNASLWEQMLATVSNANAIQMLNESRLLPNYEPIEHVGVNPAVLGELDFLPNKTFTKLTGEFGDSRMTVKAYPGSPDQDKGDIAYVREDGAVIKGNRNNEIILSPIQRNKSYSFIAAPADKNYRTVWNDYSGDLDGNGDLSWKEMNNLEKYEDSFDRVPVVGNSYTYIPSYDNPLLYYFFEPKTVSSTPVQVHGTVILRDRDILSSRTTEVKLKNVAVSVNGYTATTDANGYFHISNTDFEIGKYYNLVLTYGGISYTTHIKSNMASSLYIDIDDSFTIHDFSAAAVKDFNNIDNRDKDYHFSFQVDANKQGLTAAKALVKIYKRDDTLRFAEPLSVLPKNGRFSFVFNPGKEGVMAGDRMAVQIIGEDGFAYMEHNVGFTFKKYLNTFSLLNSFNTPVAPYLDFVGTVDAAFDLGLAGKMDDYRQQQGDDLLIAFGFSDKWSKSLSDKSQVEGGNSSASDQIKNAAKGDDATKMESVNSKAIDENGKQNPAKLTSDMEFGISTALYLRMKYQGDKEKANYGEYYFNEMFMTATLTGKAPDVRVERVTPMGVTLFVELELKGQVTGTLVIEQYDYKRFYFDGDGQIDFSKADDSDPFRDFTIYGSLVVQPSIVITAGAKVDGAKVSISGHADFDFRFYTSGKGRGDVKLTADMTLEILIFKYTWGLTEKSYNLFSYGVGADMLADTSFLYEGASEYELASRDYLDRRSSWRGNGGELLRSGGVSTPPANEQILLEGVYPYPYTLLATIGENRQLLVFLDDNTSLDHHNRTQLYYSVYNGNTWSQPQGVDDDNAPDDLPWLYDMGDRVLIAWSSSTEQITAGDAVLDTLNKRNIKSRFFFKDTQAFGPVQNVTHETDADAYSDSEPYIAYTKDADTGARHMMLVYKKSQYQGTSVEGAAVGDIINPYSALAYRFYDFEHERWDEAPPASGFYGQGFINLSVYADVKAGLRDPENGHLLRVPTDSDIVLRDLPFHDPLVSDYNAAGYENYAVLAYAMDMDNNKATTTDRELFLQLYDFSENLFYPAIQITENAAPLYNLVFAEANDTLYLFFGEDGDIKSLDVGYLVSQALLRYEITAADTSTPVMIWDKAVSDAVADRSIGLSGYSVDEFMVKSTEESLYMVWNESDIVTAPGVDPHSAEAVLPENQQAEQHIYAARLTFGEPETEMLYAEDGQTPLAYPAVYEDGTVIDYRHVRDANGKTGVVSAGDPVTFTRRPVEASGPIRITDGDGANYNDLDFEILPSGQLRMVYVHGQSALRTVQGLENGLAESVVSEDVNTRTLMTADYDVEAPRAQVSLSANGMPKPNKPHPITISVRNLALSALKSLRLNILLTTGGGSEEKLATYELQLAGGESDSLTYLWEAPEQLAGTTLRAELETEDGSSLASDTQEIPSKAVIDVTKATAELTGRNRVRIVGTAVNNGNIPADETVIVAQSGKVNLGSAELGSLEIGEERPFELNADVSASLFEPVEAEDGSATESLKISVSSTSGTGQEISSERSASPADMAIMANINSFSLTSGSSALPAHISMGSGTGMALAAGLTYIDPAVDKPRIIYVSSDESVAAVSGGELHALQAGTATITAYILPPSQDMLINSYSFRPVENFETMPEAAILSQSLTVQVHGEDDSGESWPPVEAGDRNAPFAVTALPGILGTATATITLADLIHALNARDGQNPLTITVHAPGDAHTVVAILSGEGLSAAAAAGATALTVATPLASISFDQSTFSGILAAARGEDVTLTISAVDPATLADDVRRVVGSRPVYDLAVTIGGARTPQFAGDVTVSIPYAPESGEEEPAILIYFINAQRKPVIVPHSFYDLQTGTVHFTTDHFSTFAVGYNPVSFDDVPKNSWYYDAVSFIAAREITNGTGEGQYSPDAALTRGAFLVLLMRAYGISSDEEASDNFSDAGDTYYTPYLAAAKQMGFSSGVGNNRYAPERHITRQEMFTLLYNVLKVINRLPQGNSGVGLTDFTDADQLDSWALDAMTLLVNSGTVCGSNGRLHPLNKTTRAEIAQVLYNLLGKKSI
ncbi:MAG: hypothetical protein K0R57_3375 [Paenibacillaceae bacterium]|jgi:hypothetical protein|nr:hypothetical protein [Paenibacillaceae bacterium]